MSARRTRLVAVAPEERPEAAVVAVAQGAAAFDDVRDAAAGCRACDLWARATQTVFGRGPVPARLALGDAAIDRESVFVTNAVKHFKWRPAPSGKRRLHERPDRVEIGACLPWVQSELVLVRPEALVLLGATAAQALVGPKVRVTRDHGVPLESDLAPLVVATIHPSAVLRAQGGPAREQAYAGLVADLGTVARRLAAA